MTSNGEPRTAKDLPATVGGMVDNPLRSLAGIAEVVPDPLIAKGCIPFAEFRWADYLRGQAESGKMDQFEAAGLWGGKQHANYTAFADYVTSEEFKSVAQASGAEGLPGYLPPGSKAPPIPDCPWTATCDRQG